MTTLAVVHKQRWRITDEIIVHSTDVGHGKLGLPNMYRLVTETKVTTQSAQVDNQRSHRSSNNK